MTTFVHQDPLPPAVPGGLLAGLTVAVPANLSVRGWPTRAGSAALDGYTALEDATIVVRLRQAGVTLVGVAEMSEFGLGLDGNAVGRALVEGRAGIEMVLDFLGEARLAAARAEVFGFKPSAGIVSRYGLIGLMPSLETVGLLARSPREIAAVLAVIVGADDGDPALNGGAMPAFSIPEAAPSLRTVGLVREALAGLTADAAEAFAAAVESLRVAGIEVREVALPALDDFALVHRIVGAVEASSSCGRFDGVRYGHRATGEKNWNEMYLKTRAESFGPVLKGLLFQGAYFQFQNYAAFEQAARVRARLAAEAEALFGDLDALVLPTVGRHDGGEGADGLARICREGAFTLPANILGLPALHIPGLTGGFQLVGRRLSDPALLALAERLSASHKGA